MTKFLTATKLPRGAARARASLALALVLLASCALAGCGGGAPTSQNARPRKSDFERSLDTIRTGQHVKIYVIRRADGGPLRPEDRQYLRDIEPMKTGMWVVTQDATTAIAGAGFEFEPALLADLAKRFTVEDYTNK
jgi:hypothetical protein